MCEQTIMVQDDLD